MLGDHVQAILDLAGIEGRLSRDPSSLWACQVQFPEDSSNLLSMGRIKQNATVTKRLMDLLEVRLTLTPLSDDALERPRRAWKDEMDHGDEDYHGNSNRACKSLRSDCRKHGQLAHVDLTVAHTGPAGSISQSRARHPYFNPVLRGCLKEFLDILGLWCRRFGLVWASMPHHLCFQTTHQALGGHPQGIALRCRGIDHRLGNRHQEPSDLTDREYRFLGFELLQGFLANGSEQQEYRPFRPRQWEPCDRFVLDPKLLRTDQHRRRPFSHLNDFVSNEFLASGILDLQGLGRLFVGVGVQQVLDLRGDGVKLLSELLVRGVVGFGCDVAAKVFQVIESEQDRSARGRGSDRVGKLFVDVNGISKDELSLLEGELEPDLFVTPM